MIWPNFREWMLRLRNVARKGSRLDQDFEDELAFHRAMLEERHKNAGLEKPMASRRAQHELGGIEKWKEALRDVHRPRALENFIADVKLAIRLLRKSPGFAVVALATLTIAIGANTSVFTLLDTLLLRPLPVPDADRLTLWRIQPGEYGYPFSYPIFRELEKPSPVFSDVFAFTGHQFQMEANGGTGIVQGTLVSGSYFPALRVQPEKGRWIRSGDDQPNGGHTGPVAVIGDRFWRTHFSGDPHVIGRVLRLDHVAFTVIGVMPPGFEGAEVGRKPDVYVPLALEPRVDAPFNNIAAGWRAWWLSVGARLRDGVSLSEANAVLHVRSKNAFAAVIPNPNFSLNNVRRPNLYVAAQAGATGFCNTRIFFRKPLIVIMVLVTMVLCVACLNLASLLMARSAARERELATRFALGAGRSRLLQQLLTESLLLGMAGTAAGFGASLLWSHLLVRFLTNQIDSLQFDVTPDIRVFVFAAAIAVLSTVLVGILPALRATGRNLQEHIKEGSISLRGTERRRLWPRVLMSTEIALASVLVTGAGLLGYSLILLHDSSMGFDPQNLTMLPLQMSKQHRGSKSLLQFYREFATEMAVVHGVQGVSYIMRIPLSEMTFSGDIGVAGHPGQHFYWDRVGPRYFSVMRIAMLGGREFRWTDTDETGRKAILNEAAASLLFPHQNALGRDIVTEDNQRFEVIGVVGNAKYTSLRDPAPPTAYFPITQDLFEGASFTAVFRSNGNPSPIIAAADATLRRLAPDVPLPGALSMEQQIADSLATERLMAMLASFFAVSALLITAIGLYGTLAYSTARRTGEIGIRMALGAQRGNIIWLVLGENAALMVGGCALGLFLSLFCARFIGSFLFGVHAHSPAVLAISFSVLLFVALLASLLPAIRASRVDPMTAIRHE